MSFTALDSMGKTSLMLDLISQRQRALGSNVANVDTPGYVRKRGNTNSKRYMYSNVHSSITYNSQDMEAT